MGEDACSQKSLNFVDDDGLPHFFPLDHFDDYTFEVHSPEEWLKVVFSLSSPSCLH